MIHMIENEIIGKNGLCMYLLSPSSQSLASRHCRYSNNLQVQAIQVAEADKLLTKAQHVLRFLGRRKRRGHALHMVVS